MKYYISLPINGRKEKSFAEKYAAAQKRCNEILRYLLNEEHLAAEGSLEILTPFNICTMATPEPEALGYCIQALLTCDSVIFDYNWEMSRGCNLEHKAAELYGKSMRVLPKPSNL